MLRERSPSPPAVQSKRQTRPPPPLSTRYTAEQMNSAPELEDKKKFLTMFSLSHVDIQQRRDNEKVVELLQAIKQKSVTLDSIRHAPQPLCKSPSAPLSDAAAGPPPVEADRQLSMKPPSPLPLDSQRPSESSSRAEPAKPPAEAQRPKDPPLAPFPDKARLSEGHPAKKSPSLLNSMRPPLNPKEGPHSLNGKTKPWESFTAEEFAQQFHESVLQSTQKALQKHKGGSTGMTEPIHKLDSSVHYNIPELQGPASRLPQPNGQHCPPLAIRDTPGSRDELSGEEDSDEEDEDEEEEAPTPRWQGIEAIFEAYQEYIDEQSIERQVLHSQCRRLEAHHYNLSLTAEQLSHSMGELMAQKQKLASEREKLQAELDHFRKCLALPQLHWSRGYFKGYTPRRL
ncbi:hypothetical protein MATL_G00097040 [Megalops atlanticus]|uniref:Genetic suppressor element-like domain-containing protein n=1 Tax=Megalops atlanticus TaxID=7932 RepID=A0A9D3Q233_MEGAT|nr:hypothetical protein MATL_G00097040 [Megalops atlanticus]